MAHLHWGGQSSVLSPLSASHPETPLQMPRIMFDQISRCHHCKAHECIHASQIMAHALCVLPALVCRAGLAFSQQQTGVTFLTCHRLWKLHHPVPSSSLSSYLSVRHHTRSFQHFANSYHPLGILVSKVFLQPVSVESEMIPVTEDFL